MKTDRFILVAFLAMAIFIFCHFWNAQYGRVVAKDCWLNYATGLVECNEVNKTK